MHKGQQELWIRARVFESSASWYGFGMFPLILRVLKRDFRNPLKDCEYKGEHPKAG